MLIVGGGSRYPGIVDQHGDVIRLQPRLDLAGFLRTGEVDREHLDSHASLVAQMRRECV